MAANQWHNIEDDTAKAAEAFRRFREAVAKIQPVAAPPPHPPKVPPLARRFPILYTKLRLMQLGVK